MTTRIVVNIDVDQDDPAEAFMAIYRSLEPAVVAGTIESWESTNEWFKPDGEPMTHDAIDAAFELAGRRMGIRRP